MVNKNCRDANIVMTIGLCLPIAEQIASRLASTMAWPDTPLFICPISDQTLCKGKYRSTCSQAGDKSGEEFRKKTSSLNLFSSSSPPATTTYWCKRAARRPRNPLEKFILSSVNNQGALLKGADAKVHLQSNNYQPQVMIL